MASANFIWYQDVPGPPPLRRLDPENLRVALGLSSLANGLRPPGLRVGVRKFHSWAEAQAAKEADERTQQAG